MHHIQTFKKRKKKNKKYISAKLREPSYKIIYQKQRIKCFYFMYSESLMLKKNGIFILMLAIRSSFFLVLIYLLKLGQTHCHEVYLYILWSHSYWFLSTGFVFVFFVFSGRTIPEWNPSWVFQFKENLLIGRLNCKRMISCTGHVCI